MPGKHGLTAIFEALQEAEQEAVEDPLKSTSPTCQVVENFEKGTCMTSSARFNSQIVLPLPTEDQWQEATASDPDLKIIAKTLDSNGVLPLAEIHDNGYAVPFKKGQLEKDDGLIFWFEEPRRTKVQQLCTRVVPPTLRQVVTAACHSSPFAGHSGEHKTYQQVIT